MGLFGSPAPAPTPAPPMPPPPPPLQDAGESMLRTPRNSTGGLGGSMTPRRRDPLATVQGPFKPSTSSRRALFGLEKAIRDLQLYLARVDPSCALDDSTADRALLTGVCHVLHSANKMEESAKKNLQDLKARPGSGTCVAGTPMHKDPRNAMRDQLERSKREAHEAVLVMRTH